MLPSSSFSQTASADLHPEGLSGSDKKQNWLPLRRADLRAYALLFSEAILPRTASEAPAITNYVATSAGGRWSSSFLYLFGRRLFRNAAMPPIATRSPWFKIPDFCTRQVTVTHDSRAVSPSGASAPSGSEHPAECVCVTGPPQCIAVRDRKRSGALV